MISHCLKRKIHTPCRIKIRRHEKLFRFLRSFILIRKFEHILLYKRLTFCGLYVILHMLMRSVEHY